MKHTYLLGSLFLFVCSCSGDESNNVAPGGDSSTAGSGTGARQGTGGRGTGGRGTGGASTGGRSSGGSAGTAGAGGASGGSSGAGGTDGGTPDGSTDAGLDGANTVQLTVTITGTAAGSVRVTGGSVDRTLTGTTVIDVPVGAYTVTSEAVRVDGTFIDSLFDPDAKTKSVTVGAGQAASVTVSYAKRPGTGYLWVSSQDTGTLAAYSNDQLAQAVALPDAGAVVDPAILIENPTVDAGANLWDPQSMAFDAAGNLWVGNCGQLQLLRYAVADLGTSGKPTPDRVVNVDACARGLAFAPTGALGVAGHLGPLLVSPGDLAQSGTATPKMLGPNNFFGYGVVAQFDSTGNLWMVDYQPSGTPGSIYRWSAAALAAPATDAGPPDPDVILSGGAIVGPNGLNWTKDGLLLVTMYDSKEIVFFDPAQLQATGTPIAAKRLILSGDRGVQGPQLPSFDEQGNLWFPDYSNGVVVGYSAAALATVSSDGGTPTIDGFAVLAGSSVLSRPIQAVANPAPSWAQVFTP
jgi:sugar lactone lactonase YvrE